jgi:DNA-binding MarR family transcriptional regulator
MIFAWQVELSPATKLVLKILLLNGWVTQEEIIKETYLPPRTVKYAIRNLREREVLEEKPNLDDLRRKYYKYKGKLCTDKGLYKIQNRSFR